jgi:hypothetical protein
LTSTAVAAASGWPPPCRAIALSRSVAPIFTSL